jgi:hypothetical protein
MNSAQTIILDDAHSGEDPVASMWSVVIDRGSDAYKAILDVIADALPETFAERLRDDSADPRHRWDVELVSPAVWANRAQQIIEVLDATVRDDRDPAYYRYRAVGDRIGRCLCLVSWNEILVRPLIPPTLLWQPFASATQRVYMSATVGHEGELERAFGVPSIEHLSISTPSEDLRFGRRFFLFPDAAYGKEEADVFTASVVEMAGRTLVLTPSNAESDRIAIEALPAGYPLLGAGDVEHDFSAFISRDKAAVLLANRYDGMDLPDDACRLIVLAGLPVQTHLLERFLLERLAAYRLLSERIRTRFVQGAGRCTRNSRDYAAVVVRGWGLTHFWAKKEEVQACRPDLQAEIEFGFDNADQSSDDSLELLARFLVQDETWQEADAAIRSMAAEAKVTTPSDADALRAAAKFEVEAWNAMWRDDVEAALVAAEHVLDALEGGQELRPYRALWLYLAACWAEDVAQRSTSPADRERANSFKNAARQCAAPLPWTPNFGNAKASVVGTDYDEAADRAMHQLKHYGLRGMGFEREVASIQADLDSLEAPRFHRALAELGKLLGFETALPEGSGAPDVVWRHGRDLTVVFEAKTEEAPDKPLSLDAMRQANTHLAWVQDHLNWPAPQLGASIIIGRHDRVGDGVTRTIAGDVALVLPTDLVGLYGAAIDVHRQVRARSRGLSDEQVRALLGQGLKDAGLGFRRVVDRLIERKVADL